jgi:hypothetical protein
MIDGMRTSIATCACQTQKGKYASKRTVAVEDASRTNEAAVRASGMTRCSSSENTIARLVNSI